MTFVPGLVPSVRRLLLHCEAEAYRLVAANRDAVGRLADALAEASHLDAAAVLEALGPVPRFEPADAKPTKAPASAA